MSIVEALHPNAEKAIQAIISKTDSNPSSENILALGREIGSSDRFKNSSPEYMTVHSELVNAMIKIPGHAQIIADEIEHLREQKIQGSTEALRAKHHLVYQDQRGNYIRKVLANLPSPETIKVLGDYLSDERDPPLPINITQDWSDMPANCNLAAAAISKIGLRNPPATKWPTDYSPELKNCREWWDEIKSGRKTFSFKGQNVEYRFKPDGTWETLPISNPPDDAVMPPKLTPKPAPEKAPEQDVQPSKPKDVPNWWPWLWIPALAIVAAGWRLLNRRTNSS